MTSVVLVPWGQTDWSKAGRMTARTSMPLNEDGARQAVEWANELAGRELGAVYCGTDPVALETARILADRAEVRLKHVPGLDELDVGLWEGLTHQEVESRFPKLFKRWVEDPISVRPPNGELIGDACQRIVAVLQRIILKYQDSAVAVVLGPITLAAVRSRLELGEANGLHRMKSDQPVWYRLANGNGELVPVGVTR